MITDRFRRALAKTNSPERVKPASDRQHKHTPTKSRSELAAAMAGLRAQPPVLDLPAWRQPRGPGRSVTRNQARALDIFKPRRGGRQRRALINPYRDVKALRSGRLRKELRP